MNDGELLLRAVCETPDCDTARLVYADWLQENGRNAQADVDRLRVADTVHTDCFLGGHDSLGWFPGTHEVGDKGSFDITRGFISHISLPTAAFLDHAEAIFRAHPVTSVQLTDKRPAPMFTDRYIWVDEFGPHLFDSHSVIPTALWRLHLDQGNPSPLLPSRASLEHCQTSLSQVCVAYGRKLAGLPPLPQTAPAPR